MKLVGIWTIFDNEELLEGSINQIKDHLDKVVVIYQKVSNFGEERDITLFLKDVLYRTGGELIEYVPNLKGDSHYNQQSKLKQALKYVQDYSHYIYLAADEYYDTEQFLVNKIKISYGGYDSSACRMYTYFKTPEYRLKPIENYYVPFISSVPKNPVFNQKRYPVKVDPSRCIVPCKRFYKFEEEELMMHHYSWVRRDLKRKLKNHSLSVRYNIEKIENEVKSWQFGQKLPFFNGFEAEKCENEFHVSI